MTTETNQARVGGYRLLARLGEGGMGVVHLGQADDGRRVAVKVLRQHVIGDREARERLAREVASLSRVRSPRVAAILDADPYGPTPYVATRYVPGLSLHEHVREEGTLAGADLLHLARCLAEALAAVHAVGVLHRDVKPSNVLMEGRSPVLIDFGLARLAEDQRLTQTGFLLGTPGYLAPEVLYGEDATPAADVHAWAATVCFAATGRSPYGKGPAMAVLDRVRLGNWDLSGVPSELAPLLQRALAVEPTDRPGIQGVLAWLSELERGPSPAAPITTAVPLTMPYAASHRPGRTRAVGRADAMPSPAVIAPRVDPHAASARTTNLEPATARSTTVPLTQAPAGAPLRLAPAPPQVHRGQRRALLVALSGLVAAMVAYAPYLGTAVVTLAVLLLRTASITRQRHQVRQIVRGHSKWTDVPRSTVATPWHLVVGSLGTLAAIAWSVAAAVAAGLVAYAIGARLVPGLLVMGVTFAAALWMGPGSGRLRESTRSLVDRASRGNWPTWFAAVAILGLGLMLTAALWGNGPDWSPRPGAPWASGFLRDVLNYL